MNLNNLKRFLNPMKSFKPHLNLPTKFSIKTSCKHFFNIKNEINKITNTKIKNLFFVAWLAIIEEVSNIKKEGNRKVP